MQLLDGNQTAQEIKLQLYNEVKQFTDKGYRKPHLVAILIGNDPASETYVAHKVRACQAVGFDSSLKKFEETISEADLLKVIKQINMDDTIDGFIVQLPLPTQLNQERIIMAIKPSKDVDGFHPENFGKMALEMDAFIPATPFGILKLLEKYKIETTGKQVVVLGRSRIVGKPISLLLGSSAGNATVTMTHSKSRNLTKFSQRADIIISAIGIPNFVGPDMVKKGATVIDVGITRIADPTKKTGYKLVGDVDFKNVAPKCAYITPVPGGVGPMTVTMLLWNTLLAYKNYYIASKI